MRNLLLAMIRSRTEAIRAGQIAPGYWGWFDLTGANLTRVNLADADLTGADLDYSSWPLWCGSIGVKVDVRIARQLMYHACVVVCDDPEFQAARAAVAAFANQFHRVRNGDCKPIGGRTEGE